MNYFDPPEEDYYPFCLKCNADEEDFVEPDTGGLICPHCKTDQEFAEERLHFKEVEGGFCNLAFAPEPENLDFSEPELTEVELIAIEESRQESDRQYYIERGWLDPDTNELTDAFLRASDIAYDMQK